jgi:hypothetical protein
MIPIHIYTLALDAVKFLPLQLEVFEGIKRPWVWHIVTGVAENVSDTRWCAKIAPRLSRDGTEEWLHKHSNHPNIRVYRRQLWPGKTAMCNAAISKINEDCILMQIDADEFWSAEQLEKICQIYRSGNYDRIRFYCRYYVGEDLIVSSDQGYGNKPGEWSRSWLFKPGMFYTCHEPPVLEGCGRREMSREESRGLGLVFDHFAYVLEEQVAFKEVYYKYSGAVYGWKKLQAHTQFPAKLKQFLGWVDDDAVVSRVTY